MADEEQHTPTVTIDKEVVKEALTEILTDIPAIKSLLAAGHAKDDTEASTSKDTRKEGASQGKPRCSGSRQSGSCSRV